MTLDSNNEQHLSAPWRKLYSRKLPSDRKGLFYNTFPYPTKIAPEAIALFIASHTRPGDTVLDVFGGSGSTGLAALMCEHPTEPMKDIAKKLGLTPMWGPRNAVVYEIGTYGAFASRVMANPPDPKRFQSAAEELLDFIEQQLNYPYQTIGPEGVPGVIRHIIWSDVLVCPCCEHETPFYEAVVRFDPLRMDRNAICRYCNHTALSSDFEYAIEEIYDDLLEKSITQRKRVPVRIYGRTGRRNWVRATNEYDELHFERVRKLKFPTGVHPKEISWGDLYRAGYHTGITHLHHFYTKRNFLVMHSLWEKAGKLESEVRDAVKLLILSYNAAHSTLMTRVVVKNNSKDFVVTSAQSGVLYISSLPVEKNIFDGVRRKIQTFSRAFTYLRQCSGRFEVIQADSRQLREKDESVDYVFTDPPFGDFIPYAEVNQINELWLDSPTERASEIIISEAQGKDVSTYERMMTDVFREVARVMKKDALATVVFHSSKAAVWNALQSAYSAVGLSVHATSTLSKGQTTFKQGVARGSVESPPLILLSKQSFNNEYVESKSHFVLDEVVAEIVSSPPWNAREIFAEYVRRCLQRGITVEFDARAVYDYVINRSEAIK